MKVPAVTRELVTHRDGLACARCGSNGDAAGRMSLHHRRCRGAGGTRSAAASAPSNLVLLCGSGTTGCHGWVEANRADAYDLGWLVRHGVLDTAEVPVPWRGRPSLLLDDGTVARL